MTKSIGIPFFSDFHAPFVQAAISGVELNSVKVYSGLSQDVMLNGLRYSNNDACYSAIAVIGQVANTQCDTYVVPQICADCRSQDEIGLIKRSLRIANRNECSVVKLDSLLSQSREQLLNELVLKKLAAAIVAGDVVLQATLLTSGHSNLRDIVAKAKNEILYTIKMSTIDDVKHKIEHICEMTSSFAETTMSATKIALVGNAPVLFCNGMNANIISLVEEEGCRVVVPPLSTFVMHAISCNSETGFFYDELKQLLAFVRECNGAIARAFVSLDELRALVKSLVPSSLTYGAGWLLPAFMICMANENILDIAYLSTFGCLSGHVVGKGAFNLVRECVPNMNIVSLEFDQGTSVVNQINRMKLLVSMAKQRPTVK